MSENKKISGGRVAGRKAVPTVEAAAHVKRSFQPLVGETPEILILGSLPGEESLRRQEYYGKPQNRFWPLMARLTDSPLPRDYAEKQAMLKAHRIALWDVVRAAEREGSADTDIRREVPNDIPALLNRYPTIRTVAFNGKKAAELFRKHYNAWPRAANTLLETVAGLGVAFGGGEEGCEGEGEGNGTALHAVATAVSTVPRPIRFLILLSTSPANCQYSEADLQENWRRIFGQAHADYAVVQHKPVSYS